MIRELLSMLDWLVTGTGVSHQPPLVQAGATITLVLLGARYLYLGSGRAWLLIQTPRLRHVLRVCEPYACNACSRASALERAVSRLPRGVQR